MKGSWKISRESYALAAVCAADLASTIFLVNYRHATEGNPLMAKYLEYGVGPFVIAKAILCLMPLFLLEYARRRRPRIGQLGLRVALAGYLLTYVGGVAQLNQGKLPAGDYASFVNASVTLEGLSLSDRTLLLARQTEFYRQAAAKRRTAQLP